MSGATLYLLGRHLTNRVTDTLHPTAPDHSPVLSHKDKPHFVKVNIANQCKNYRNEDYDVFFSALESHIDQVSIGSDFLLILLSDGSLYTMGINRTCFQMGITTVPLDSFSTRSVYYLHQLKDKPVKMISSGGFYNIVATRDDELYGIGSNDYGQFSVYSISTHKNNAIPLKIDYGKKEGDKITHITCCFSFSVVIVNGNDMRVAGQDWIADETQISNLVNSRHVMSRTFKKFPAPVYQLKSGAFHVIALLEDGRIFCCGSNSRDQLGNAYNTTRKGIQEVFLDNQIEKPISINCGSDFSLFLKSDKTLDRLGSSRYPKFDVLLFKGLEKFKDVLDVNMCEQLLAISRPECIHVRGNNNTFTLGDGEDEYYELDLDYNDIFQTPVTAENIGISARYYHIAFYLKTNKKISKHFIFLKKRVDCCKLSDITIKTLVSGGFIY